VGGHVDAGDACHDAQGRLDPAATLRRALLREVLEELGVQADALTDLRLLAAVYEGHSAVGRVHLGLLYSAQWIAAQAPAPRPGEALNALGFVPLANVATDPRYELWSQLAAVHLLTKAAHCPVPTSIS
jgi:predicted NUDIX family phosphoesterase